MPVINGNANNNTLTGTAGDDTLNGFAGNDILIGGLGADRLNGGIGEDWADYRNASAGITVDLVNAALNTGEATGDVFISIERLRGGMGDDKLYGDGADNVLEGSVGADLLNGRGGYDFASYRTAASGVTVSLTAPATNTGEAAGDTFTAIENLWGSVHSDVLTGDSGVNHLRGGKGGDTLDGKLGFDYANYRDANAAVVVSLADRTINTGDAAGDSYLSVEGVVGSDFSDRIVGDRFDNRLDGAGGQDVLDGGQGFDLARYKSSATAVTVSLSNPSTNTGDAVGDTFIAIEGLQGSDFDDTLTGNTAINILAGGSGADRLDGQSGFDYASYAVDDIAAGVTASLANSTANTGDAAGDTYVSIEGLIGSKFADVLIGNSGSNYLDGSKGGDVLNGGGGIDFARYVSAEAGVTASLAAPGTNTGDAAGDSYQSIEGLIGSDFGDLLTGNAASNTLTGGLGRDRLNGGGGHDVYDFNAVAESGTAATTRDIILQFQTAASGAESDKIDLSTIDSRSDLAGNQAFTFVNAFSKGTSGQVMASALTANSVLVSADLNGDALADFSIEVRGVATLGAGDFVL